jgi:hypothetical protein
MAIPHTHAGLRTRWDRIAIAVLAVLVTYAGAIFLTGLLAVNGDGQAAQLGQTVQNLLGVEYLAAWCDRQGAGIIATLLRALADPAWLIALTGSTGV